MRPATVANDGTVPANDFAQDSTAAKRLGADVAKSQITAPCPDNVKRAPGRPLKNAKHEQFAHLLAKGESPARAYVSCGYSENGALQSGNRLLKNAAVGRRVDELKAAVSERTIEKIAVDRAWLVNMLVENVNRAMQVQPVRDRKGNPIGRYTYEGAVANKALEILAKIVGGGEVPDAVPAALAKARLIAGRQRLAEERKAALAKGLPWP